MTTVIVTLIVLAGLVAIGVAWRINLQEQRNVRYGKYPGKGARKRDIMRWRRRR